MKPATFQYQRPQTLDELLRLLDEHGGEAKILAGGQSLVPMMNMRLARPEMIIDINRIRELDYIRVKDGSVEIGALTRQCELERSEPLQRLCPILPYAVSKIGHYAIRQRGTVGGSIAHADPSAELPLMALLLDADIRIVSAAGERTAAAESFFLTIYTTDLMPNELIRAVEFRTIGAGEGWAYNDFTIRSGDFAIVSVGCVVGLTDDGRVGKLKLAVGGVDDVPRLMREEAEACVGRAIDGNLLRELTESVVGALDPRSDLHASREFRIDLLRKLIPETVEEAVGRTGTGGRTT